MKIKWYGHATFVITTEDGVTVCTDPVVPGSYDNALSYKTPTEKCDVVLQSHDHPDHAGADVLKGGPVVIKGPGVHKVKGLTFTGVATFHDESNGRERGANTVFAFVADGLKVVFAGDLGHLLSAEQVKEIGPADVLMLPVGGYFTIDAASATKVAEQLQAKVVIPMHYKTPACGFPIAAVDEFLQGKPKVERVGGAEAEFAAATPGGPRVVVLDYVK